MLSAIVTQYTIIGVYVLLHNNKLIHFCFFKNTYTRRKFLLITSKTKTKNSIKQDKQQINKQKRFSLATLHKGIWWRGRGRRCW